MFSVCIGWVKIESEWTARKREQAAGRFCPAIRTLDEALETNGLTLVRPFFIFSSDVLSRAPFSKGRERMAIQ